MLKKIGILSLVGVVLLIIFCSYYIVSLFNESTLLVENYWIVIAQ